MSLCAYYCTNPMMIGSYSYKAVPKIRGITVHLCSIKARVDSDKCKLGSTNSHKISLCAHTHTKHYGITTQSKFSVSGSMHPSKIDQVTRVFILIT